MENLVTSLDNATEGINVMSGDPFATPPIYLYLYRIVGAIGISGNLLVLFVFGQSPILRRKPINIFILNQSVVDLLGCLAVNLRLIYNDMEVVKDFSPMWQRMYCKFWLLNILHIVLYGVSGYNLLAMSFERHQAIVRPFQYDESKVRRRLPVVFLGVWLFPFLCHVFMPFLNEVVGGTCLIWFYVKTVTQRILVLCNGLVFLCFLPSTIIITLYTRMGMAIKFGFADDSGKGPKKKASFTKAQMNIFSTCLIMVVAFLLCWSLYMGTIIVAAVQQGYIMASLSDVFYAADLLLEVNSAINPIIYAFRYNDFQSEVKRLLRIKPKRAEPQSMITMTTQQ